MLADGFGQLLQSLLPEHFPGLGRVGADGTGRQEHHPAGLHIGFQLLALHGHSSSRISALIVAAPCWENTRNLL